MVNQPAQATESDSKEGEQEEYKDITEQDIQHLGFATQIFGALMLVKTQKYTTLKDAYAVLNDPKLAEKLLDFEHPEELLTARGAVVIANKEIRKKAVLKKGFAETRFFFWKSQKLTPEQFRRATHTTYIAKRVNKVITRSENNIRFRNAINIFNISDENQFRTQVSEWIKKNPGRSLDEALYAVGVKSAEIKGDKAKEARKKLEEQNKGARKLAIEGNKTIIDRANEVIKNDILDPNKPEITHEELAGKLEYVEKGYYAVNPPKPASVQPPTPSPAPVTPTTVTPTRVIQQPIISKIPFKFTLPKISLPSLNLSGLFKPLGSLLGRLGTSGIASTIKTGLAKLGGAALTKLGLGAATGGILPIASEILNRLTFGKIDIDAFVFNAAKLAILFVVGVFIGIVFILSDSDNPHATRTPDNPLTINVTAQSQRQIYSWSEFEEKFLTRAATP